MPENSHCQKTWSFPRKTEHLAEMREELVKFFEPKGFKDDFIYRLKFCTDEAASNIIEHGGLIEENPSFDLSVQIEKAQVVIVLKDHCHEFDPTEVPDIDIKKHVEEGNKGGLGIEFLKKLLDSFEHRFENNQNILKLVLKIPN